MENAIVVRSARPADKDPILAFCQNTFSWGDYIADVWDLWLTDTLGRMFVAQVGEQPVGVVHAALADGAAWMEGMRVHPDFRQRGVATAMDVAARAFAREHACSRARLVTSVKNIAAQALLARIGYRRVAQFNEWEGEAAEEDFATMRVATLADAPALLALWRDSAMRAASASVVPTRHWRWLELNEARLRERIATGEARLSERGLALLLAYDEKDWCGLNLHALAGDDATLLALARAARGEAYYRGYPTVGALVADHPGTNAAMERAGYRREGGVFLYEIEL